MLCLLQNGEGGGSRTHNLRVKSPVLLPLSYAPTEIVSGVRFDRAMMACLLVVDVVPPAGLEPATPRLGGGCSIP